MIHRRPLHLLVSLALFAVPLGAAGQASVGLQGGVNFAAPPLDGFSSEVLTGEIGGGFVRLQATEALSVQIEALYTAKGFSASAFATESSGIRTKYLDLPVTLKLRVGQADSGVRPFLMVGAFWGTELSCSTTGDIVEVEGDEDCEGRFGGRGTADVGFLLGGSFDFDIAERLFLILDGRFRFGVRNLHFDPESDFSRSRGWSFMGGFGVPLGG